jgi:hypothetical protein
MRFCLFAIALGAALSAPLCAEIRPGLQIPQIEQYYDDINYVATHSSQKEQATMVAYRTGRPVDYAFLKDKRLKAVYDKLISIMTVRLDVDPGIFRGPFGNTAPDCSSTAEPIEVISRSNDQVVLKVARRSVGTLGTGRTVDSILRELFHAPRPQGWTSQEIDFWLLVDQKWRIHGMHIYPIAN